MHNRNQADFFSSDPQADLFDGEEPAVYRPDPEKVRARLHRILSETRARNEPWDWSRASLYRTIFPQLTLWLPEEEAGQLRLEFNTEMERLQSA
jgi:hypothetical protein